MMSSSSFQISANQLLAAVSYGLKEPPMGVNDLGYNRIVYASQNTFYYDGIQAVKTVDLIVLKRMSASRGITMGMCVHGLMASIQLSIDGPCEM